MDSTKPKAHFQRTLGGKPQALPLGVTFFCSGNGESPTTDGRPRCGGLSALGMGLAEIRGHHTATPDRSGLALVRHLGSLRLERRPPGRTRTEILVGAHWREVRRPCGARYPCCL